MSLSSFSCTDSHKFAEQSHKAKHTGNRIVSVAPRRSKHTKTRMRLSRSQGFPCSRSDDHLFASSAVLKLIILYASLFYLSCLLLWQWLHLNIIFILLFLSPVRFSRAFVIGSGGFPAVTFFSYERIDN
ncbi:hypothetical protein EDB82DRAFT_246699 [Fusarium venenatum]|uniref:uncharacterized protein n=1 Tax=Fusarium venenatum TaxID=56646 RepID=UPI001DBFE356|nr:hypothetical protein EDB82DRAFT_246699 [Fusarium venenatum]